MKFSVTYYGSSGWFINFDGFNILIDPWLTGDLVFSPGPWLIKGELTKDIPVPDRIDLLLLTQGLPDHAHPPSLELLNRSVSVICSPSAFKVIDRLGFWRKQQLVPGEVTNFASIYVEATEGARVPTIENGYIVSNENCSFYIEPHGYLDKNIKSRQIDTVITPVVNLSLPLAGSFIKGKSVLPDLIQELNPKTVISSTTGGDAIFTGLLNNFISVQGSIEEANLKLMNRVRFIDPVVGKSYSIN